MAQSSAKKRDKFLCMLGLVVMIVVMMYKYMLKKGTSALTAPSLRDTGG